MVFHHLPYIGNFPAYEIERAVTTASFNFMFSCMKSSFFKDDVAVVVVVVLFLVIIICLLLTLLPDMYGLWKLSENRTEA